MFTTNILTPATTSILVTRYSFEVVANYEHCRWSGKMGADL